MRPVTCSLIIILPISKPHINFIVFSLCGKKQLYYLMIKRYELDRIKPNTVDKLQPVYGTCTRHTEIPAVLRNDTKVFLICGFPSPDSLPFAVGKL